MQRESDKHGSRLDEAMAHEVEPLVRSQSADEARVHEERLQEDMPVLDEGPLDERAELARHIAPADWPADRSSLIEVASRDHAPDEVLAALRQLPAEARFANVQEVWSALGGPTEGAHTRAGG
jgi:hypothetical protein